MKNYNEYIGRIISWLIIAAGVVFTISIFANINVLTGLEDEVVSQADIDKILNPDFYVTAIALGLAALLAVLFPVGNMISNPKAGLRMLISLAVLGLVYFISYSLASGNTDAAYFAENDITEKGSKLIGSLIYLIYIVGGLAVFVTVLSGIYNLFNK